MKPRTVRILVFLSIVSLVTIGIAPSAAALTWSTVYTDTWDTNIVTPSAGGHGVSLGNVGIFAIDDLDADVLLLYRCQQAASPVCVKQSREATDDATDFSPQFISTSSSNVAYCFGISGAQKVYQSTNAGLSYSSTTSPVNARDCGLAISGTSIWVASGNSTDADVQISKSTDGGSTWSPVFYVETSGNDLFEADTSIAMAASDANNVILLYTRAGGGVGRCYTTNGGDSTGEWTCGTSQLFSNTEFHVNYDSAAGKFRGIGTSSATSIEVFEFSTVNGLPTVNTVDSGSVSARRPVLQVYNSTALTVAWTDELSSTELVCKFAISNDNGLNWVAETAGSLVDGNAWLASNSAVPFGSDGAHFVGCAGSESTLDDGLAIVFQAGTSVIGSTATASVTGTLQGFDVDDNGDTVIVRSNNGEIRTYSGTTLGTAIDSDTSDVCNSIDRVMSIGTLVGYVICDGTGDPTHLRIRTAGLDVPTDDDFNGCEDGSFTCSDEIELDGFTEAGGDCLAQLGKVDAFPVSYESSRPFGTLDRRRVAWAFSDIGTVGSICTESGGKIGVDMYTNAENDADIRRTEEQVFAGTPAEEICTGIDPDDDQFYIGAAGTDANTKVYPFTFSEDDFPTFGTLDGSFGSATTFSSTFGQADSVDCGGSLVITRNDNVVGVLTRTTGTVAAQKTITTDSNKRAATISQELDSGQYAAYLDDGVVYVTYANNLTTICTLTPPTGTWREMEFASNGPSIFIATTTTIARYQIGGNCGAIPDTGTGGTAPPPAAPGGLFGGSGATVGAAFGTGAFGGNLFLGAVLMGIVAYGVGTGYGNTESGRMGNRALRVNPWAAAVGAAVGFLMAWGFGFFSTAVVFSLVALVGMIVGIRLWVSRG